MTKKYSNQLLEASKRFNGTKYQRDIDQATMAYLSEDYKSMEGILARLPTEPELLEALLEKLKGKSVEKGIRKALKENSTSTDQGKALSSLITHIIIESETNSEYKALLPDIYKRLGEVINK